MMETNSNRQALVAAHMAKIVAVKNKIQNLNIDCNNIEDRIINDQKELENSISKINTTCPIKTNEFWISWFNTTDVEETFKSVYNDIVKFKNATEKAFNASFNTSITTLLFLQELAEYELDLYSIIDESELTSAELSDILATVLKDNEENDEIVAKLFKQAQNKAIRLKERMDSLKNNVLQLEKRINRYRIISSLSIAISAIAVLFAILT